MSAAIHLHMSDSLTKGIPGAVLVQRPAKPVLEHAWSSAVVPPLINTSTFNQMPRSVAIRSISARCSCLNCSSSLGES